MWFNKKKTINQDLINKEADQFALRFSETQEIRKAIAGGVGGSSAGIHVDERTALNSVIVFACIRAIAETLASLPFPAFERETRGKTRRQDHPVHRILNITPDEIIPAMNWRESIIAHALSWGNGYSENEFYKSGEIKASWILPPNKVQPVRTKSGNLEYKVRDVPTPIPADRMTHISGLGFDGVVGYSPIKLAASAIGLGMACERFGSTWFGNGSRGQAVLKHPGVLSDVAQANLRNQIESVHQGPDRAHRLMILEDGMSLEQIGIPPEDAQFLQTRLFQIQEICRLYRISPVVVQDLSRSTFSNNEQEMTSFVVHTLRPWARRFENEVNRKMFSPEEQKTLFAEHLLDGLLRGDTASRNAAYATARQWGWQTANDICELENFPQQGAAGDIYIIPAGYVNVESLLALPEPEPQPQEIDTGNDPEPSDEPASEAEPEAPEDVADATQTDPEAVKASLNCVRDNIERMLRRESEIISKAARKPKEFLTLIDLYSSREIPNVTRALQPSLDAFKVLTGVNLPDIAGELVQSAAEQLLELSGSVSADDLPRAVEAWVTSRAALADEIISRLDTYTNEDTN